MTSRPARRLLVALALAPLIWATASAVPITDVPSLPSTEALPPKLAQAVAALKKGSNQEAASLARDFVKEQPQLAVGHEVLGLASWRLGRLDDADTELQAAVRLDPGRISSILMLGQLALERGQPARAEVHLRRALTLAPNLELARGYLADALVQQGRSGAAIAELQESLRITQGVTSRYLLAKLQYELGRTSDAEKTLAALPTTGPLPTEILLLQGLVKLELRKYEESDRLLRAVTERDQSSDWARLGRAMILVSQGLLTPARQQIEKLVAEKPAWPIAQFQLGRILLLEKRPAPALEAFGRAEKASPDSAVMRVRVGQVLLASGDLDGALARAKASVASPTAGRQARALILDVYTRRGMREGAESDLVAAVASAPAQDVNALLDLGGFYLSIGRPKEAAAAFEKAVRLRPNALEPLAALATAQADLQRRNDAIATAERVVNARGGSADALVFLGSTYERLGDSAEATKTYRRALGKSPNHLGASRAIAAGLVREKRYAEAVRLLDDVARANPTAPAPLADVASVQLLAGRPSDAVAAYRRALERDPNDPTLLNNLAYLLSRDPAALDEAAALADRAVRFDPGHAPFSDTAGWVAFRRGDLAKAERLLSEAARIDPRSPEIRYHLGLVYAALNRKPEARREIERALELPGFQDAQDARNALEKLK